MTERTPSRKTLAALLLGLVLCAPAAARQSPVLTIGYLELEGDARYAASKAYARIALEGRARPFPGAELGVADATMIASAADTELALERITGATPDELVAGIKRLRAEKQSNFFLIDLPEAAVLQVVKATQNLDILLFNISADGNRLRAEDCAANLVHVYPSLRMQTDALSQYLRAKDWGKVWLLVGAGKDDLAFAESFRASAKRYGLRTVGERPFELSNDPRERTKNNVALLTASTRDYDVVILADRDGEFARYVPFATSRARPVIGSTGLVAVPWHWTFERFGAPQLNGRFVRATQGRHMSGADWAAWVAVKAIVQARVRANAADFDTLSVYLKGAKIRIDGFKGVALSFRPWNNQLRQPLLLATHDAVIATAPVEGFLHQTNTLDTLGVDEKENTCRFE
jgi:ABC transporter substrate binding protein (PQQ-dependent alcohol dehydrogenase system)